MPNIRPLQLYMRPYSRSLGQCLIYWLTSCICICILWLKWSLSAAGHFLSVKWGIRNNHCQDNKRKPGYFPASQKTLTSRCHDSYSQDVLKIAYLALSGERRERGKELVGGRGIVRVGIVPRTLIHTSKDRLGVKCSLPVRFLEFAHPVHILKYFPEHLHFLSLSLMMYLVLRISSTFFFSCFIVGSILFV